MDQRVKELMSKVADEIGSEVKTCQSGLVLMISLPNERKQEVFFTEVAGGEYLKFLSVVKFYADSQEFKTKINLLETVLRANVKVTEGAYGIVDLPSPYGNGDAPALVFVSNQHIKTADLEEIENKIASAAKYADELEKITSGGLDSF